MKLLATLAVFSMSVLAAAQTVPIDHEPHHHLVLSNQYMRAFYVEVPTGEQTLMHQHKTDYIYVTLGDTTIANLPEGKPTVDVQLHDGEIRFSPPIIHVAKNLSDHPFRNVTIELLKSGDAKQATGELFPKVIDGRGFGLFEYMDNGKVRAVVWDVHPSSTTSAAAMLPCLLIAISDVALLVNSSDHLALKSGDMRWFDAGQLKHLKNQSKNYARFAIVEFK